MAKRIFARVNQDCSSTGETLDEREDVFVQFAVGVPPAEVVARLKEIVAYLESERDGLYIQMGVLDGVDHNQRMDECQLRQALANAR